MTIIISLLLLDSLLPHLTFAEELTVVVGAHDLRKMKEGAVRIDVRSYYRHRDYSEETLGNDIMLLRGDSGGPLVCGDAAVGVTSFGDSRHSRVNVGIVNGTEAKPHSRPYMVSVQASKQHICGGFLISDRFVMTAAHCRNKSQVLTVVLGAHDLQQKNLDRINVDFYHKHPDYTSGSFHNDILLLRLEKHVKLNNNIKWISIPMKEDDIEADTVCSVAGWGSLKTNGTGNNRLMETDVTVLNNMKCESKWGKKDYSASQMMCVYGNGGSCDVCKKHNNRVTKSLFVSEVTNYDNS
ncbi:Granzyme B(G,H) [Anabarilius grahami]|uniref:trypsin n=1 Tax=Anabarilius grahami TaxID=495550 RepID=A0A3N0Y4P2_ANAGA|nr:Granzyme B(G,H) [Anabarilius grahami]